jgi:hypothetical protein
MRVSQWKQVPRVVGGGAPLWGTKFPSGQLTSDQMRSKVTSSFLSLSNHQSVTTPPKAVCDEPRWFLAHFFSVLPFLPLALTRPLHCLGGLGGSL